MTSSASQGDPACSRVTTTTYDPASVGTRTFATYALDTVELEVSDADPITLVTGTTDGSMPAKSGRARGVISGLNRSHHVRTPADVGRANATITAVPACIAVVRATSSHTGTGATVIVLPVSSSTMPAGAVARMVNEGGGKGWLVGGTLPAVVPHHAPPRPAHTATATAGMSPRLFTHADPDNRVL